MTYPESCLTNHGGPLHRYLYVHGANDKMAEAIGHNPSTMEAVLCAGMVDVRLWDARQVWYTHKAYQRKAVVQGPFIVSGVGVESDICSGSGYTGFVRVYADKRPRLRRLTAHYCWPSEELAQQHAALLNARPK